MGGCLCRAAGCARFALLDVARPFPALPSVWPAEPLACPVTACLQEPTGSPAAPASVGPCVSIGAAIGAAGADADDATSAPSPAPAGAPLLSLLHICCSIRASLLRIRPTCPTHPLHPPCCARTLAYLHCTWHPSPTLCS